MNRFYNLLVFALFSSFTISQQTVGILDFEGIGISPDESKALSNRFGTEFQTYSSGRYVLVERQQMGAILEEQGLQQSGCVSSECAVEVGNALGAKFIVTGSISKVGNFYSVNAKLINVETSEIVNSISYDQSGNIGLLLTQGMQEASKKLLGISSSTPSQPATAKVGSIRMIALEKGITLHNVETGKFLAVAPTSPEEIKNLEPGTYRFLAKKNGFKDKIFEVQVFAGSISDLTISGLEKPTGTISFNVDQDASSIYFLNNSDEYEYLGSAPLTTGSLPYGINYSFKITKDGFDDVIKNVIVRSTSERVDVNLVKSLPSVTINARPEGVSLTFDNQSYSDFTSRTFKVNPGPHPITISKEGYISQTDNVYLDYGDNKELNFSLVPAIAEIHFTVNIDDYNIFWKGAARGPKGGLSLGNTKVLKDAPFGNHNFLIEAKKYETSNILINVESTESIYQNVDLVRKTRQKAFIKSILLPGSGQRYAESKAKGLLMTGLHIGAGVLIYSNYTKYNDSVALKNDSYTQYKNASDLNAIAFHHKEYEANVKNANDAAGLIIAMGATFAINWAFSAIDALLFSDL